MNSGDSSLLHGANGDLAAGFFDCLIERGRLNPQSVERVRRVGAETSDRVAAVLLKPGLPPESIQATAVANVFEEDEMGGTMTLQGTGLLRDVDIQPALEAALRVQDIALVNVDGVYNVLPRRIRRAV